ncbi:hypothetical protein MPNT_160048 [Candidatus Methylacidithermus pantelleriae]|uniref:Uncharacterized protein n=1 Tax=Candidatus Methylacidithermus pantelleriae TaxID=2744239 RepID=A0A8J2FVM5_9BACT|nr:hypothetical protein MPNT_160048 [Candidatus Methylacidithermus pantelleriae]
MLGSIPRSILPFLASGNASSLGYRIRFVFSDVASDITRLAEVLTAHFWGEGCAEREDLSKGENLGALATDL